jgi:hypothetical protein
MRAAPPCSLQYAVRLAEKEKKFVEASDVLSQLLQQG